MRNFHRDCKSIPIYALFLKRLLSGEDKRAMEALHSKGRLFCSDVLKRFERRKLWFRNCLPVSINTRKRRIYRNIFWSTLLSCWYISSLKFSLPFSSTHAV